jgi:peptide-methionine (S)-S-oxide reductase
MNTSARFAATLALTLLPFAQSMSQENSVETLVLGAGCFWCVEGVYENVPGVISVESGFAGGTVPNPTYNQVTSGDTGHAEVVRISYDPARVTPKELVELFWEIHDPTDPRGVAPDFGPMYRSILLAKDEAQLEEFKQWKQAAQKNYQRPIITELNVLTDFYPAEDYHQDFVRNNPGHPYVRQVALPKMQKAGKALEKQQAAGE